MGRGGSRKGERRGNAKPRTGLETPNAIMRAALNKPPAPGRPGKHRPNISSTEKDLQISQIVHGRKTARDLSPKEIVLDNMHHFQQAAYTSRDMIVWALGNMPAGQERSDFIAKLQLEESTNRRIASDEAYKVMPFIHARRAAVNESGETVGDGTDVMQLLLDIIDRQNREQPMVIEHIPTKRTA